MERAAEVAAVYQQLAQQSAAYAELAQRYAGLLGRIAQLEGGERNERGAGRDEASARTVPAVAEQTEEQQYLTPKQAAEMARVTRQYIYNLVGEGILSSVKRDKARLIPVDVFEEWMATRE